MELGYALSSEEHGPRALVRAAARAEDAGFSFALISDHYHPWTETQGQSPFVWGVLGGIAEATTGLRVGTGVTCPTIRIHPAIVAHAAATAQDLMDGRFFLGVGAGESLNEHVVGQRWPAGEIRLQMLEEAVAVIRLLFQGGFQSHYGRFFTVENARIYSLPDPPPPIYMASSAPASAEVAGRIADGFVTTSPERELVEAFDGAGGRGKPHYGQLTVCWAKTEAEGRRIAKEIWPNAGVKGEAKNEVPLPRHIEEMAASVTEEELAKQIVCGPDPERHVEAIREFADAGFEYVYVHQIGRDQEGFFRFYEREILPRFR